MIKRKYVVLVLVICCILVSLQMLFKINKMPDLNNVKDVSIYIGISDSPYVLSDEESKQLVTILEKLEYRRALFSEPVYQGDWEDISYIRFNYINEIEADHPKEIIFLDNSYYQKSESVIIVDNNYKEYVVINNEELLEFMINLNN